MFAGVVDDRPPSAVPGLVAEAPGGRPALILSVAPRESTSGSSSLLVDELLLPALEAAGTVDRLSVKTVQYHLTRVYARLGVQSRSELAAVVHRRRETG